ncbi:hypothetical protein BDV06DRAFT_232553 [Aspergillus oleicola]
MSVTEDSNIGFIGLGAMGRGMAANLAKRRSGDSKVYVYDVVDGLMNDLLSEHPDIVRKSKSAKEVSELSDIIFTMVPEGSHVRDVYMSTTQGICAADISNKVLVDCSTIDIATCIVVRDHIATNFPSARFYDAPVSGGTIGAANGSLSFFLGCGENDPTLPHLQALLANMGKRIIPCGGPTLGLAAKLAHNYLGGLIFIAGSEAMNMGIRAGLDARVLANVFSAGAAQSTIMDRFNPVPGILPDAPSSNNYAPGFKIQLHRKDFGLAIDMAKEVGSRLALGDAGLQTFKGASSDPRCKDLDSSVVYRYLGGVEDWPGRVI